MRALFLVLLGAYGTALAADEVSFVNEGVIPAPIDEVWRVFSTSEGYKALGPALAEVDLRVGGVIRSRYRADGVLGDAETIGERHRRVPRAGHDGDPHPETARFVPVQGSLKHTWTVLADADQRWHAAPRNELRLRHRRRVARDATVLRSRQPANDRHAPPTLRRAHAVTQVFAAPS
jgi:uncharacterized protein YndB with AHSA1/START domain